MNTGVLRANNAAFYAQQTPLMMGQSFTPGAVVGWGGTGSTARALNLSGAEVRERRLGWDRASQSITEPGYGEGGVVDIMRSPLA